MTCQRYSMFTPEDQPFNTPPQGSAPQQGPTYRVLGGVDRQTTTDGVTTTDTQAPLSFSAAQINPHHGTQSVLATARSKSGSPVSEVVAETLVTINGLQAPAEFWRTEGWLTKDASGTYSEVQGGPQAALEAAPSDDFCPLSDQDMAGVNQALDPVPQANLDGLAGKGVAAAIGALDPAQVTRYFTEVTGINPAESQQRVEAITQAFQGQADKALTDRFNIGTDDRADFYAWARANHRDQLQAAVSKQVHTHDVSGYRALADRYLAEHAPTIEAFQRAGVPIRGRGASAEVQLQGRWMTPAAAARAGLA